MRPSLFFFPARRITPFRHSPIEPAALPAVIEKAHQAKIPVAIGDVGVAGKYDAYIVSSNEDGDKLAAQYMLEHLNRSPGARTSQQAAVLSLTGISKEFPGVRALLSRCSWLRS